ncbi:MAG TPA: hypothetical protein VFH38_13360 [Jatrophihabitans sp.]|nr:hypothetical protein [Jatrophihabitans sp.]
MTTDPLIRKASWNAPLILAPCAAALFGASVWWAAGASPAASSAGTAPAQPVAAPAARHAAAAQHAQADALYRALRRELTHRHQQAAQLEHRLQALRAKSGHLHIAMPRIPSAPVGNVPAPVQPAPAPPAVNTVSGASG